MEQHSASNDAPRRRILVVDPAAHLRDLLPRAEYDVEWIDSPTQVGTHVKRVDFDVALLDLDHSSSGVGLGLCRQLADARPETPIVVMTERKQLETVVGAMRSGAYDFIAKPIVPDVLLRTIERALRHRHLRCRLKRLSDAVRQIRGLEEVVGTSASMRNLFETIDKVAATDISVLITGESGTGKEVVAQAIHRRSERRDRPFVGLNCGAVPPNLLESELFGHVKGAYTSARDGRRGLFGHAEGGTILLDEIGEMPLEMQVKLLRVLQEHRVRPVGGDTEIEFDARIIAATNRDLAAEVAAGRFRQDLFYRINVVQVDVPPLRDRANDVLGLSKHFVLVAAERLGRAPPEISTECARRLSQYGWPGNVRELENAIEHAVALSRGGKLEVRDLPPHIAASVVASNHGIEGEPWSLPTLSEVEYTYVHHVLSEVNGNKTRAAEVLGLDRRTLYRRLAKFERIARRATARSARDDPSAS